MKTIQLTHGNDRIDLNEEEALSLYAALSQALDKSGIDPLKHSALSRASQTQTFKRSNLLTDC